MNKFLFAFVCLQMIAPCVLGQRKKAFSRGFSTTITVVSDIKDPENSRSMQEVSDRKGRLIQYTEFDINGIQILKKEIDYHKNQKIITTRDSKDSLLTQEKTTYNKQHQIIEVETIKKGGKSKELILSEYNKWGLKIKESIIKNEQLIKTREYIYNNQGLLIEQKTFDANHKLQYQKTMKYSNE